MDSASVLESKSYDDPEPPVNSGDEEPDQTIHRIEEMQSDVSFWREGNNAQCPLKDLDVDLDVSFFQPTLS